MDTRDVSSRSRLRAVMLLAVLAVVVGSCASGTDDAPASPPAGTGGAVVAIEGFQYRPKAVTIGVGDSVTWENRDEILHTATAGVPDDQTGVFDGVMPERGESFTFRFEQAGTFAYFCTRHNHMRGTITVAA